MFRGTGRTVQRVQCDSQLSKTMYVQDGLFDLFKGPNPKTKHE